MDSILNYIKDHLVVTIIIAVLVGFIIYAMFAVLINKLYSSKYGKETKLSWIPILNIYLLGKLVIHSIFGIILVLGMLALILVSFNIPGLDSLKNIIPSQYVLPYQIGYGVIILLFLIIGKMKLNRIIRDGKSKAYGNDFVNKNFEEKEPEVVVNTKPVNEVSESIRDNFQYNSSPLSNLNNLHNHDNQNDNSNTNQNP